MTMASPLPPLIAATAQRRRQLLLQHRLDEAADATAQTGLDRVEPSVARKQPIRARRCRAILVHGVVSSGAPTPGFGCRVAAGDYVTPFPTTSQTGPKFDFGHLALRFMLRGKGHRRCRLAVGWGVSACLIWCATLRNPARPRLPCARWRVCRQRWVGSCGTTRLLWRRAWCVG